MRKRQDLEAIKNFIDSSYNHFGNRLLVNTDKMYDPEHSALGFCYKYKDEVSGNVVYRIECSKTGIPRADFRILMHEYGHIYKGHLDEIHEELDAQVCNVFMNHRVEILDEIVKETGLDRETAEKLIERVIDDPEVNHSLHNIAEDMEVNSTVLSKEDVEEMEADITTLLPSLEEESIKNAIANAKDEEYKKKLSDAYQKMLSEVKIKFILPCRYYMGKDDQGNPIPFPDGLTYVDYLILIIKHIDQFVKMMVSIKMGGNGDTSDVSQDDIRAALNGMLQQMQQRMSNNQSEAYKQGYRQAMRDAGKQSPEFKKGLQDGYNKQKNSNGSEDYNQGFEDGLEDEKNNQNQSQDYKDGFQDGRKDGQEGKESKGNDSSKSEDYNKGYQDGHQKGTERNKENGEGHSQEDYENGYQDGNAAGENKKQCESDNGSSGGQDYDKGFQAGQELANGQNQGQGQQQQGSGQQEGQGQGQESQEMSDYNQGYQDAMNDLAKSQGQGQGQEMQGLSDLMGSMGITQQHTKPDPGQKKGHGQAQKDTLNPYEGLESKDFGMDHKSDSRNEADNKRAAGQIQAGGGVGCGKTGAADITREVDKHADEVDMAMGEVINDIKCRVIKQSLRRDVMKNYNRGIIRSVIAPSISRKISISTNPKIVFLLDISGSMDTRLVDRILRTISKSILKINRDLRYDIITWSTRLGEHIKDINPRKGVPRISCGGGTDMASGMRYFKENYKSDAILVLISDFEDNLDAWHSVESSMKEYSMWGFNYGDNRYSYHRGDWNWKYFKQRNFSNYGYDN